MKNPSTPPSTTTSSSSTAAGRPKGKGGPSEVRDPQEWEELPEAARGVIELFNGAMAKVAFPDVDGAVLRQHAERVLERRHNLETARIELEAATIALQRGVDELNSLASRGLAYARIYAAAHPELDELSAELAKLDVRGGRGRSSELEGAAPAGKRGRKKQPRPELPFGEAEAVTEEGAESTREPRVAAAASDEWEEPTERGEERDGNEESEDGAASDAVEPGEDRAALALVEAAAARAAEAQVAEQARLVNVEPVSVRDPGEAPAASGRGRRGARSKPVLELVEPTLERD
jgi:hypothetical protein